MDFPQKRVPSTLRPNNAPASNAIHVFSLGKGLTDESR
jgi:hypothetical protein